MAGAFLFEPATVRAPARPQEAKPSPQLRVVCRAADRLQVCRASVGDGCALDSVRREVFVGAVASLLTATLCSAPGSALAAEQDATLSEAQEPEASSSGDDIFETIDFYFKIPRGFQQAVEAVNPRQNLGRGQGLPQTPLKARFLSEKQGAQLTIVSREAFQIKPLFFQCQDISQLGSVNELSKLVLPPGSKLLFASSAEITQPDRDLSKFEGFVQQPRQTIYRYDFETNGGLRVTMAAAARLGKIFFAGGTAPIAGWDAAAQDLREAVGSFRLLQPIRNV